jgi:hypothetical protein
MTTASVLQSGGRVVLPTNNVEEGKGHQRLCSGSKWRQYNLALLRVKFEPNEDSGLSMLDVEHEWTLSQRQRIPPGSSHALLIASRNSYINSTAYINCSQDTKGPGSR